MKTMKRYDKRQIMLNAWFLFRAAVGTGKTFGDCLRSAWASAKNAMKNAPKRIVLTVKSWFLRKNFSQGEGYSISTCDYATVKAETEKAYKLKFDTDFGVIVSWFPKSVLMIEEVI